MLAQILKLDGGNAVKAALFAMVAALFASCAHDDAPLIADPTATHETALPWNEQQKWERDGSASGLNTAGRR